MARALTVEQAAEFLQLSPYTIRQWLRTGKLPGRKIGRVYRILDTDLEALVGARPETAGAVREAAETEYRAAQNKPDVPKKKTNAISLVGKYARPGRSVDDFLREKAAEVEEEEKRSEDRYKKLRGYGSLAHVEGLSTENYLKAKREDQQRENER